MRAYGLALLAGVLAVAILLPAAVMAILTPSQSSATTYPGENSPSALADREIPAAYLHLYEAAGRRYGIRWEVLAGIGKVECDHGQDPDPSCSRPGAVNESGAGGPMQFLASTFARYGVAPFGGRPSRWDPADAIFSAARYLVASGAPHNYRRAIYAYNHAWWYVEKVLAWARRYRGTARSRIRVGSVPRGLTRTPVIYIAGTRSRLDPRDGHVALIPRSVPAVVKAMLIAGNELQDLPYGPQGHPDPLGAVAEDCSSTVNYVLYRAGVRPLSEILRENPLAQDYVRWGAPGRGRWVTIYATDIPTPHVFMVIAGLRLDTARAGIDIGPNRNQDGPRWRIYPTIPAWARWSVRHPSGL